MKKVFLTGIIAGVSLLTGCVASTSTYERTISGYPDGNISSTTIQYTYGNGYWYDNQFDYYDGLYGTYIGGIYYVYRRDGSRYPAPPPRYRYHRFIEKGWDGYRPGYNYDWKYRPNPPRYPNGNRPPFGDRDNRPVLRPSYPHYDGDNRPNPSQPPILRPNQPRPPEMGRPTPSQPPNGNGNGRGPFKDRDEVRPNSPREGWNGKESFNRDSFGPAIINRNDNSFGRDRDR